MINKSKILGLIIATTLIALGAHADDLSKLTKRSQAAAAVLKEVMFVPDHAIPKSLLDKAVCVATVPSVIRAAFVFGARYGQGLVSCRTPTGWSHPSYMNIKGGSWGLQIGVESIDLVLVFVQPSAVRDFSKANFTVGVDATVAAGPIG